MKKQRGFTVVELLVSFSFVMIISVFLFQIVLLLKDIYFENGIKTEMYSKQSTVSQKINDDFFTKGISSVNKCGSNCLNFTFHDSSTAILKIDKVNNSFSYSDYTYKLVTGSYFGDIDINVSNLTVVNVTKNNAIMYIKIPVYHNDFENQDFGINVIYQHDSNTANIISSTFNEI